MAFDLSVRKRLNRPQVGFDPAELMLKRLQLTHWRGGTLLLLTGVGKLDQFIQRTCGYSCCRGKVQQWNKLRRGLVKRSGYARLAREIEDFAQEPLDLGGLLGAHQGSGQRRGTRCPPA